MKSAPAKIVLRALASDSKMVESMAQELEGKVAEEGGFDSRWPTRFISAGNKGAPPRWAKRFLIAGPKSAPTRD